MPKFPISLLQHLWGKSQNMWKNSFSTKTTCHTIKGWFGHNYRKKIPWNQITILISREKYYKPAFSSLSSSAASSEVAQSSSSSISAKKKNFVKSIAISISRKNYVPVIIVSIAWIAASKRPPATFLTIAGAVSHKVTTTSRAKCLQESS